MLKKIIPIIIFLFSNTLFASQTRILREAELVALPGISVDLGSVLIGQSQNTIITLSNQGAEDIIFDTIYLGFTFEQILFLGKDFPGSGGTCAAGLKPQQSCTMVIAFQPKKDKGTVSTFIKITYKYGETSQKLQLTLSGESLTELPPVIDPGVLQATPIVSFGVVKKGHVATKSILVSNTGASPVIKIQSVLNPPFSFSGGTFPGTGGSCGDILQPGNSCLLFVSFQNWQQGTQTQSLKINYFDGISPQELLIQLQAIGK